MINTLFVISGNCRTFIECIDSIYNHVISKLFKHIDCDITIYLYLKLSNPGSRNEPGSMFTYNNISKELVLDKINELIKKFNINIKYTLLEEDAISDKELLSQVKDRSKYIGQHFCRDDILLRALHCHYNFEQCGNYIINLERINEKEFEYIIYIRPDLFFTNDCKCNFSSTKVTLGMMEKYGIRDHIAIIPREHFQSFFFDRMNIYRTNTTLFYGTPEEIYMKSLDYEFDGAYIGTYYIKRQN